MTSIRGECHLSKGFSLWEKLYAQLSFFAMLITGTAGIARSDWPWLHLILLSPGMSWDRHAPSDLLRCPHLYVYGIAFNFPPTWAEMAREGADNTLAQWSGGRSHLIFS
jgi:hypothetical protein